MKELKKLLYLFIAATLFVGCSDDNDDDNDTSLSFPTNYARSEVTIGGRRVIRFTITETGSGTGTVTWAANENGVPVEYVLDGYVFVNPGQTLTIQPGAVVKGQFGTNTDASALVVAAGARIFAEGTASSPIIFTYEEDDVQNNNEGLDRTPGRWGGLIVLGNAPTNHANERVIEGVPTTETRGVFGGPSRTTSNDNSGVIRYVSIRNTGVQLTSGNELQGLTLGGVGSGTTIENVESIFSNDDGIEIFGGTANLRNILIAFAEDDGYDLDNGYAGRTQNLFIYSADAFGTGRNNEWDGDDATETVPNATANGQPYATGIIANMTSIGTRASTQSDRQGIMYRNNAAYSVYNSIISTTTNGIRIVNTGTDATRPTEFDHINANRGQFLSNVFAEVGASATDTTAIWRLDGSPSTTAVRDFRSKLEGNNNKILANTPLTFPATDRLNPAASNVNPVPSNTTGFPTAATLPGGFATANYIGAFDPAVPVANSWINWTFFYNQYAQ